MAEVSPKKPVDMGKILGFVFMAINLVVLGGGAFLVYTSTIGYHTPMISEDELDKELNDFRKSLQNDPIVFAMDTFNTNLEGVPRRFIRIKVNLEMLDEEGFEEVIDLGAEAKDSIVRILNEKRFMDLESVQGKLQLKNQIIAKVNSFLKRGVVKNVYFSDFVVQ